LSKKIKWDELKKVDILIANLSDNINKTLIDEIILTIEDAISQFQISKTDLIESLEKSNELISESYIFDLKYKIAELKNKLQIVKFIESKENTNKFNEYFKSYLDNNSPTKGSANEFINLAIPGSGVIQRQIDQLNEKINLSIKDLPLIFFNNQLIQLVESEFFKNQIINYNKFPYNSSNLFYLNDYEIDNDSLSFNLAITYFSFFIIFSLISAIIFYIILDIIRKYN
jgi:phenylalanyl-tRNA synthetase alpha subunit